ncbi:MAG: SpoIIE family protein phosphatase [Xanthomonadaceae bacterium]|nr:SpoIIE family protein phosphatase [Xanthomonadaceae bacterium]MDE1960214.1 SpoIIE family protein phosphatase [Xanthomonadaceae bacterium]MDE2083809.1 SpoIIE family protein phosphatase [Xanthomonadaceae bacterium]MDE2258250.1 SpoIIE family protein phosphatase [Xanthomonadaceae bacterium]
MPSLIVTSGALAGQVFGFSDAAVIGRGQFSEVRLNDPTVSRRHASIRRNGAAWEVSDQDSANGTLLRGMRIAGPVPVTDGDELQFGEVKAVFRATPSDQPSLPSPSLPSTNSTRARAAIDAARADAVPGSPGLRDLLARLKLFCDIGALSRRPQDLRTTLDEALHALLATFPQTSRAAVYARHGGTETLTRLAQQTTATSGGSEFALADAFLREALRQEYGIEITDDPGREALAARLRTDVVPAALLGMPLRLGGETLGALYLESAFAQNAWRPADRELFAGVAGQLAWLVASQQAQSPERLVEAHDLALARRIQQRFLPQSAPVLPGYRFADSYAAARVIGGDYFDYFQYRDGRHGLVIADVSGKAVSGALYMARLSVQVRVFARNLVGPDELLAGLNRKLAHELEPGMFVTMLAAAIEPESGRLEFANAGHPAPLLRDPDRRVCELGEHGALPLGAMSDTSFPLHAATITPGACLLLYTDGLDEAHDVSQQLFGKERVIQTLADSGGSAQGTIDALLADVARFTDGQAQSDDLTLITVARDRLS